MRFFFWIILIFLYWGTPLQAKPEQVAETPLPSVTPTPSPKVQEEGGGAILFFPELQQRPEEGRHLVQAGQEVSVCVRFNPNDWSFFNQLLKNSIGFRLNMEDQSEPPQKLTITIGNRLEALPPDGQNCLRGVFRIPTQTKSGVYQVADFLIAERDQSYYSLRDKLYQFSLADELKVENPGEDTEAPQLISIQSFNPPFYRMKSFSDVIKIRLDQFFTFLDNSGKLDPKTLKVYYQVWVDDHVIGLHATQCHRSHPQNRFRCTTRLANPKIEWGMRQIALELHSVQIKDRSGNELVVNDSEVLQKKAQESPLKFVYEALRPWPYQKKYDLKRQPN